MRSSENFFVSILEYAEKAMQQVKALASGLQIRSLDKTVFRLGFVIFFLAKVTLVLTPMFSRAAPVEADDAYTYIVKAAQLQSCFEQDCPALESLRPQLLRASNDPVESQFLFNIYLRVFAFFQPLYSLLLSGLNAIGLSWEGASNAISLGGIVFLSWAVAHWLRAVWGWGVAGVSLLFLTLHTFPQHGLNMIVASNLSLGIALIIWTAILKQWPKVHLWTMLGIVLMILMHVIGFAYAATTLVLFFIAAKRPLVREARYSLVASSAFMALAYLATRFIHAPELSLRAENFFPTLDVPGVISGNFSFAAVVLRNWVQSYGSFLLLGLILLFGLMHIPRAQSRLVLLMGLPLALLVIGSVLFPNPGDILFQRIWVPANLFVIGLVGQAVWAWGSLLGRALGFVPGDGTNLTGGYVERILARRGWLLFALLIFGLLMARGFFDYFRKDIRNYRITLEERVRHNALAFDPDQAEQLLAEIERGEAVLYMQQTAMTYMLTQGALQQEAVFYPAIKGNAELETWTFENFDVAYVVAQNPIFVFPNMFNANLLITEEDAVQVRAASGQMLVNLALRLENSSRENCLLRLVVGAPGAGQEAAQVVPPGWFDWLPVGGSLMPDSGGLVTLSAGEGCSLVLNGLRFTENQELLWPWDQGVELTYISVDREAAVPITVRFTTETLLQGLELPIEVLADGGSLVLAKVLD